MGSRQPPQRGGRENWFIDRSGPSTVRPNLKQKHACHRLKAEPAVMVVSLTVKTAPVAQCDGRFGPATCSTWLRKRSWAQRAQNRLRDLSGRRLHGPQSDRRCVTLPAGHCRSVRLFTQSEIITARKGLGTLSNPTTRQVFGFHWVGGQAAAVRLLASPGMIHDGQSDSATQNAAARGEGGRRATLGLIGNSAVAGPHNGSVPRRSQRRGQGEGRSNEDEPGRSCVPRPMCGNYLFGPALLASRDQPLRAGGRIMTNNCVSTVFQGL